MRIGVKSTVAILALIAVTVGAFAAGTAAYRTVQRNQRSRSLVLYGSMLQIAGQAPLTASSSRLSQQVNLRPVELFSKVEQQLHAYYVEKIQDHSILAFGTADSMVDSLGDPASRFLEPAQLRAYTQRQEGVYAGIGAILAARRVPLTPAKEGEGGSAAEAPLEEDPEAMPKYDDPVDLNTVEQDASGTPKARFEVFIAATVPGGPAEEAGLLPGDTIHKVNGKLVFARNLDSLDEMLAVPTSGSAKITVMRKGTPKPIEKTVPFRVTRLQPVSARKAGDVGVITLRGLGPGVADAVRARLRELQAGPVRGIVLDLRNVADGDFSEACAVANLFVTDGVLLKVKEAGGKWKDVPGNPAGTAATRINRLAVLVDETTAGPAEAVAAVVKARAVGHLIGGTTLGRAGRQQLFRTDGGTGVLLTTGLFAAPRPGGGLLELEGTGIAPDTAVSPKGGAQDVVLERALQWIANGAA